MTSINKRYRLYKEESLDRCSLNAQNFTSTEHSVVVIVYQLPQGCYFQLSASIISTGQFAGVKFRRIIFFPLKTYLGYIYWKTSCLSTNLLLKWPYNFWTNFLPAGGQTVLFREVLLIPKQHPWLVEWIWSQMGPSDWNIDERHYLMNFD